MEREALLWCGFSLCVCVGWLLGWKGRERNPSKQSLCMERNSLMVPRERLRATVADLLTWDDQISISAAVPLQNCQESTKCSVTYSIINLPPGVAGQPSLKTHCPINGWWRCYIYWYCKMPFSFSVDCSTLEPSAHQTWLAEDMIGGTWPGKKGSKDGRSGCGPLGARRRLQVLTKSLLTFAIKPKMRNIDDITIHSGNDITL